MGIIVDSGIIIPYASGLPAQLATRLGDPFLLRIIGFGSSISNQSDTTIDLTGGPDIPINLAFSVPRDGVITSIAAFFSSTDSLSIPGSTITITAPNMEFSHT